MTKTSKFHYFNLKSLLTEQAAKAKEEVIIIAPFIKKYALKAIIDEINSGILVHCITRWRLEEIVHGVSDLTIWNLIKEKENGALGLYNPLHAKYFRFDGRAFVGSANVTETALSDGQGSNTELLYKISFDAKAQSFEQELILNSLQVDQELYDHYQQLISEIDSEQLPFEPEKVGLNTSIYNSTELWMPKSREPRNLYIYYSGRLEKLTSEQREHAKHDLGKFPIPNGLNQKQFNKFVAFYLNQHLIIRKITDYTNEPRRFGEMKKFIGDKLGGETSNDELGRIWQTLMRWLIYYFNGKFNVKNSNYSEIFMKIY